MNVSLPIVLLERWTVYQAENPVWTLDELVKQLLQRHFDEADIMKESIQEQEEMRREE